MTVGRETEENTTDFLYGRDKKDKKIILKACML
jgi:hypothetical protein